MSNGYSRAHLLFIVIYANDNTLYSQCNQASDLWQQQELISELESIYKTLVVDWGRKCLVDLEILEKLSWFHLTGLITLVLLM